MYPINYFQDKTTKTLKTNKPIGTYSEAVALKKYVESKSSVTNATIQKINKF